MLKYIAFAIVLTGIATGLNSFAEASAKTTFPLNPTAGRVSGRPGEQKKAEQATEAFCGITNECHVDSRVNVRVNVYINGVFRGTIAPGGDIYPLVGDLPQQTTYLYAVTTDGRHEWRQTVNGNVHNFHWILNR